MKPKSTRLYPFTFDEMYDDERTMPMDCSEYMALTMHGRWEGETPEIDEPLDPSDYEDDESDFDDE